MIGHGPRGVRAGLVAIAGGAAVMMAAAQAGGAWVLAGILAGTVAMWTGVFLMRRSDGVPASPLWVSGRVWLRDGWGRAGIRRMRPRLESGARLVVTADDVHLVLAPGPTTTWAADRIRGVATVTRRRREHITVRVADPSLFEASVRLRAPAGTTVALLDALAMVGTEPVEATIDNKPVTDGQPGG